VTPEQAAGMYRRAMANFEDVKFRTYSGSGLSQTSADKTVKGRPVGLDDNELVGPITQGEFKVIVLHEDLIAQSVTLPISTGANSKMVVRGKEVQVKYVDRHTRALAGTPIGYDITVIG
jgi:hypothetical protein